MIGVSEPDGSVYACASFFEYCNVLDPSTVTPFVYWYNKQIEYLRRLWVIVIQLCEEYLCNIGTEDLLLLAIAKSEKCKA